ncbi:MAG: hypothetical protein KDB26_09410 [Microthrixaceae bacterium]|nr:hypothetical protein [Microthrixaceae bacterium]
MTVEMTCPAAGLAHAEFPWMDTFTVATRDGRVLTWTRTDLAHGVWDGDAELVACAAALSAAHESPGTFAAAAWAAQTLMPVPGELVLVNRLSGRPRRRGVIYRCGHEHATWHPNISGFLTPPTPRAVMVPEPQRERTRCCGAYKKCPRGLP